MVKAKPLIFHSEVVARRFSLKKLFLEISQNSQENTWARDFFLNIVAGLAPVAASVH